MQVILGDRRSDRRYPLRLQLRYKLLRGNQVLYEGSGVTSSLSRGGVSFETGRFLPSGLAVEVAIDWPILLRGRDRLTLRIGGRVLRSNGDETVIRTQHYDFVRAEPVETGNFQPAEALMFS